MMYNEELLNTIRSVVEEILDEIMADEYIKL